MTATEAMARLIDQFICPECGGHGMPKVAPLGNIPGVFVVAPVYQCSTPGCEYEHTEGEGVAWTLAFQG